MKYQFKGSFANFLIAKKQNLKKKLKMCTLSTKQWIFHFSNAPRFRPNLHLTRPLSLRLIWCATVKQLLFATTLFRKYLEMNLVVAGNFRDQNPYLQPCGYYTHTCTASPGSRRENLQRKKRLSQTLQNFSNANKCWFTVFVDFSVSVREQTFS